MSKLKDLTGKKYNHLLVLGRAENEKSGRARWTCLCDCGNTTVVTGVYLRNGSTKSCGCLKHVSYTETHGKSKDRIYSIWRNMRNRCNLKNHPAYKYYGARGISVCEEWDSSFESFYSWSLNHGYNNDLTIERKDNNKGYNPDNCEWIPMNLQQRNRRNVELYDYNGKSQSLTEWCEELHLPFKTIYRRIIYAHMPFEEAITKPIMIQKRNKKARTKYD